MNPTRHPIDPHPEPALWVVAGGLDTAHARSEDHPMDPMDPHPETSHVATKWQVRSRLDPHTEPAFRQRDRLD